RGNRTVVPSLMGTPQRRESTANEADSAATRRSHHSATPSPPAHACPSTAAITGFLGGRAKGPSLPAHASYLTPLASSFRSAPEQKLPPAPHSTATRAWSSCSKP